MATPIGNLDDLSARACTVLREVDAVLAEDTRRTRKLFDRYAIATPARAFHEHNERAETPRVLSRLLEGERLALVCDAGTPLVSDPGFVLVREARSHHVPVHCVPGPSAVTAALSVSGLPTDRFTFEGFLPARRSRRLRVLDTLAGEKRTMVFYEAPHRLVDAMADLCAAFGNDIARRWSPASSPSGSNRSPRGASTICWTGPAPAPSRPEARSWWSCAGA